MPRNISKKKNKTHLASRIFFLPFDFAYFLSPLIQPHEPEVYAYNATYTSLFNPQHTWYWTTLGIKVAEHFKPEWIPDMHIIHALFATQQNRSDKEEAWTAALSQLGNTHWKRLGNSRNVVKSYDNSRFIKDILVFKENSSRNDLICEATMAQKLAASVQTITVAEPLHITSTPNINGKYVYILRHCKGETLHEQLSHGNKTGVGRVVDSLADIHCHMPTENMKPLDLEQKIMSRLQNTAIELPHLLAHELSQVYQQICTLISKHAVWVWCKDAHSLNWIMSTPITVIDCEANYTIPAWIDLATLLIHDRCFTDEEKNNYIKRYATRMAAQNKPLHIDTAMFDYRNAELYRFASFLSAWSLRPDMHEKRSPLITDALHTIELQKQEPLYRQHKDVYESLEHHLPQITIHITKLQHSFIS